VNKKIVSTLLHDRVVGLLESMLPPEVDCRSNPLPHEIAKRIVKNFELVGLEKLRDQILIILADYRGHSYSGGKLKQEGTRIFLADRIVDLDVKEVTFRTPYEQYRDRDGQKCVIVRTLTEPDEEHDAESLPMHVVCFEDGTEIEALPEEVADPGVCPACGIAKHPSNTKSCNGCGFTWLEITRAEKVVEAIERATSTTFDANHRRAAVHATLGEIVRE
jgi:hypothetical protein